jgi:hypothetical protein
MHNKKSFDNGHKRGTVRGLSRTFCLLLLSGCSALPQTGPAKTDLLQAAANDKGVVVVELTPQTVAVLRKAAPESFSGSFPSYRPAGQQVIGVGDTIQITLWEAAGCSHRLHRAMVRRLALAQQRSRRRLSRAMVRSPFPMPDGSA